MAEDCCCVSIILLNLVNKDKKWNKMCQIFALMLILVQLELEMELELETSQLKSWAMFRSSRPEVFCEKDVLRNFAKFTEVHLRQSLFLNKIAGLIACKFVKKRLLHRWFPVNFAKLLKISFFTEHLWWLLLYVTSHVVTFNFILNKTWVLYLS